MLNSTAPRKGRFSLGFPFYVMGSLFYMTSWLAPNHYPPWVGFHNEAAMFAALTLFLAGSMTDSKTMKLPASTLAFFIALIVLIWLQWGWGVITYSGDALVSSLFIAGAGFAWYLGARTSFVSKEPLRVMIFAATLTVIAACASSFIAILQWLNQDEGMWFFVAERGLNRAYANLAQPNLLATLLAMGVVFSYLLYLCQQIRTWQLLVITVSLSFGLITTESRAGLLSAFCLGIFFLVRARPEWRLGEWRIVAIWWGLLLMFASIWSPLNELLALQPTRGIDVSASNGRLEIWRQVIAGITEAPWCGYGWRQTVIAQSVGVDVFPGELPTDYAHNVMLDVLAWVGLPLGILLLLFGAWWILRTIRNLKNSTEFALFAVTIPFLVHSLVEFPFAFSFFLFPIAWIFGFLHARQMPQRFRATQASSRVKKLVPIVGLLGFAILCALVAREYFAAEEDFRVMRFEMRKVGERPMNYQAPRLVLLTQLDDLLRMGRLNPTRSMSTIEIEHLRLASFSRHWGALDMKYVIALGLNGKPDDATGKLRNVRNLYGGDFYRAAADELRKLRDEKYPELALVRIDDE